MNPETKDRLEAVKCDHKQGLMCAHPVSLLHGKPWLVCQAVREIKSACPKKP